MAWKQTLQGTHSPNMNASWWVVGEINPLCGKFQQRDGWTDEHMNGWTERKDLFSTRSIETAERKTSGSYPYLFHKKKSERKMVSQKNNDNSSYWSWIGQVYSPHLPRRDQASIPCINMCRETDKMGIQWQFRGRQRMPMCVILCLTLSMTLPYQAAVDARQ